MKQRDSTRPQPQTVHPFHPRTSTGSTSTSAGCPDVGWTGTGAGRWAAESSSAPSLPAPRQRRSSAYPSPPFSAVAPPSPLSGGPTALTGATYSPPTPPRRPCKVSRHVCLLVCVVRTNATREHEGRAKKGPGEWDSLGGSASVMAATDTCAMQEAVDGPRTDAVLKRGGAAVEKKRCRYRIGTCHSHRTSPLFLPSFSLLHPSSSSSPLPHLHHHILSCTIRYNSPVAPIPSHSCPGTTSHRPPGTATDWPAGDLPGFSSRISTRRGPVCPASVVLVQFTSSTKPHPQPTPTRITFHPFPTSARFSDDKQLLPSSRPACIPRLFHYPPCIFSTLRPVTPRLASKTSAPSRAVTCFSLLQRANIGWLGTNCRHSLPRQHHIHHQTPPLPLASTELARHSMTNGHIDRPAVPGDPLPPTGQQPRPNLPSTGSSPAPMQ